MIKYDFYKGEKIRYSDTGKGRAVVLIHGFLESLDMWDQIAAILSKRYRVIAIDLPGHGQSSCIGYIHDMNMMAGAVHTVMNNLRLRRYAIIGHSMGGYAAMAFSELFSDNVKGICLLHSTPLPDSATKKKDRDRLIELVKNSKLTFILELVENLFAPENRRHYKKEISKFKRIAAGTSPRSVAATLEGIKLRPGREWILQFAKYPFMIIAGKKDTVIDINALYEQAALGKNCKLVVLEYSAHMGFIEEQQKTIKSLKHFLSACFYNKKL